ncbi:aminotransferase class III-fold pyridoxal phosphate-dependent enzyme [Candidatus Pelagibacter ubique]|nr:aminotransferase class III-fold pyridoxal phosphate-dependent enzyme [Candidatus Pelagibacter ubique]
MRILAIVQARVNSIRLPNKVMKKIVNEPMIGILLKRLSKSKLVSQIILATSKEPENRKLIEYVEDLGFHCMQGSTNDVLDRYFHIAEKHNADAVVRITGDCPLIDPNLVDLCIDKFLNSNVDYFSNTNPPTFPDGLDIEVMRYTALKKASLEAKSLFDREHVTPYIKRLKIFSKENLYNNQNLSNLRWTVDDPEDFEVISNVFEYFKPSIYFGWKDVLSLNKNKPELFKINSNTKRDEGSKMSSGQKLWKKAKKVISGGNMLLSKRPEMFLPEKWPAYYSRSKGCSVWDLDGREYIDMSIMGIGTNILGYGHPEVDEVVMKTVRDGNMSTLNSPEEVNLAEKLIEMHPWSSSVRFARSGGEANAIAIRIARCASGRDNVAICGYHGWHDWYLSANLNNNKSLDGHLLSGLEPNGVPKNLKETVFPFKYNEIDELKKIVKEKNIGIIKMEVYRNIEPKDNFLKKVREIANDNKIILIFDECTSGFRETFGGIHKKYSVDPDMAMFGKALGNGYAITAVLGRKKIMDAAQSSFISSTFWTERIGPSAALKTLEIMERDKSWDYVTKVGKNIHDRLEKISNKYDLKILQTGLFALTSYKFQSEKALAYKTLITQEMLKKGFLASNSVYVCTQHTKEIVERYFYELETVFSLISECENGRDVNKLLEGPICHSGFERLN